MYNVHSHIVNILKTIVVKTIKKIKEICHHCQKGIVKTAPGAPAYPRVIAANS